MTFFERRIGTEKDRKVPASNMSLIEIVQAWKKFSGILKLQRSVFEPAHCMEFLDLILDTTEAMP